MRNIYANFKTKQLQQPTNKLIETTTTYYKNTRGVGDG